jgi:methylamine utilization protein MauE
MVLFGLSRFVLLAGFAGAAVLLAVFTVAIGLLLRRGDRRPCHCFGVTDIPLGPAHLVRNLVLLALAVTGFSVPGSEFAVAGVALACVAGVVVAVLMVRFDDLVTLFAPPDPAGHLR